MKFLPLLRLIALLFFILSLDTAKAQGTDNFWVFYSPEIRYFYNNKKIEVRYRPKDYLSPYKIQRNELMIGCRFFGGKFNVYSHSRIDDGTESFARPRVWTGIRLDGIHETKILKKNVTISGQYRFFKGLNDYSTDTHILVEENYFWLTPKIAPSTLFFAVKSRGSVGSPELWFGPSIVILNSRRISCLFSVLKDFSKTYDKMLFLRVQAKLY